LQSIVDIVSMAQTKKPGRHATGKITVSIRMNLLTKTRIEANRGAASMSEYVEKAVEAQLAKDKPAPDFAAFFRKHPLIAGGDEVLQGLLQEREESL
jgi:hypothetical protein